MSESQKPAVQTYRAIVSMILQRSTIDLFAAYGIAVAPVPDDQGPPAARPRDHVVGAVQITAPVRGMLTMSLSAGTVLKVRPVPDPRAQLDCVRELTNQLAGSVKRKFARYGLVLQKGLPTALPSSAMPEDWGAESDALMLLFRTLRDEIVVTLSGGFNDKGLAFGSGAPLVEEGDIVLF